MNIKLPKKITNRDMDILKILWNSSIPMTASQITAASPDLTINTVQAVLRKLLKSNLVKVANIVYSGTVLSRSYVPTLSSDEFAVAQLTLDYQKLGKNISKASFVCSLLDTEMDRKKLKEDIIELEQMLTEYKKNL